MKRFRGLLISVSVCVFLFAFASTCSAAQTVQVINDGQSISIKVNGNQISLDRPPYISNGRTMVPLRVVAENLGCEVSWDAAAREITITGDKTVKLVIGSSTAVIDGTEVSLDAPATIVTGWTMVPLIL